MDRSLDSTSTAKSSRPCSKRSARSLRSPLYRCTRIRGYCACTALIRWARCLMPSDSAQPMWISPPEISPIALNSSAVLSTMSRMSSALRRSSIPSSVSRTLKLLRTKSFLPSSASRSLSCLDRVGWEIWSRSAAWVTLPSRATSRK